MLVSAEDTQCQCVMHRLQCNVVHMLLNLSGEF